MQQTTVSLQEVRAEASQYLGREVADDEWRWALPRAARKLNYIIAREGDGGGERRRPYYLAKLVEEAVSAQRFTRYCEEIREISMAKRKTASEESGHSTTTSVYQITSTKVNQERRGIHEDTYTSAR